jgi:hypothetical protein
MTISEDVATPPAASPVDEAGVVQHRSRRRALMALGVVTVVVVLLGGRLVFGGDKVRQSSEDDARRRLGAAPTAPIGSTVPLTSSPLANPPAQGLYRYTGSGTEHTSFPPLTENQGPDIPATVVAQPDGCWVLRMDYNTHHWQDWTYCSASGSVTEQRGSTFSRRSIGGINLDNTSTFVCDPAAVVASAAAPAGATQPRSCAGSGTLVTATTTASGTMTDVGPETIDVGGQPVLTIHVHYDLAYTGAQTGSEKTDNWFAASTGLPVRNERHITVITDSPVGKITYTEDADLDLQTMQPV